MTTEANRQAYLKAMGIDTWRLRGAADLEEPADAATLAEPQDVPDVAVLDWEQLQAAVSQCTACALSDTRTRTVFGVGSPSADWMIVGEAPGAEEDRQGEPFVGRAGKLLDQMLLSIGLDRQTAFIANTLKCHPPNNRDPLKAEAAACRAFLERQIELVKPKIVLAVGRIAAQNLLESDAPLGRLRGQTHFLQDGTLPLVVTYHPAYLLRSPSQKGKAWADLVMARNIVKRS